MIEIVPRRPLSAGQRVDVYLDPRVGSLGGSSSRVMEPRLRVPAAGFSLLFDRQTTPSSLRASLVTPNEMHIDYRGDTATITGLLRVDDGALMIDLNTQRENRRGGWASYRLALPPGARVVFHPVERLLR